MTRAIPTMVIFILTLTSCTAAQRESAAWVLLTPIALVVGPIVVGSQLVSDAATRDLRAEEWQAATAPMYLSKIEAINSWSPVEDANYFWRQNEVVYWRANNSRNRFTGLNPKSASELVEIDRETILANYQVYANNPELYIRAAALANELVGITYPRDYTQLNGVAYACYEETAAKYEYVFNTEMARLTGDYDVLPDYSEQITMDIVNPCQVLESSATSYIR